LSGPTARSPRWRDSEGAGGGEDHQRQGACRCIPDSWTTSRRWAFEEVTGQAIGTVDTNELGDFNPQLISSVGVNPTSLVLDATRANGVTTALVTMRGGRIPAQASVIDLGLYTNDEMNVRRGAALWVNLPAGRGGGGRGAGAERWRLREQRQRRRRRVRRPSSSLTIISTRPGATTQPPAMAATPTWPTLAMQPYLEGKLPVIVPASAAADIRSAIDWGKKQKVKLVIAGANYAWQAIPDLQAAKNPDGTPVPVLYGPVTTMPGANDPYDAVYSAPAALAKANIPFAIITRAERGRCAQLDFQRRTGRGLWTRPRNRAEIDHDLAGRRYWDWTRNWDHSKWASARMCW